MNHFAALPNIGAVVGAGEGISSSTPGSRVGKNVLFGPLEARQPVESGPGVENPDVPPADFSRMLRQVCETLVGDGPGNSARPSADLLDSIAGCEGLSSQEALLLIRSVGGLRRGFWKAQGGETAESGNAFPSPPGKAGKAESGGEEEAVSYAGGCMGLPALLRHPELAEKVGTSRLSRIEGLLQRIQGLLERLQTAPGTAVPPEETLAAAVVAVEKPGSANTGNVLIPDGISLSKTLDQGDAASASDGKILLVSDPGSPQGTAVHALQKIIKPLKEFGSAGTAQSTGNDAPPAADPFLISRFEASRAPEAAPSIVSDSRAPELASAVRKTQAVIREMLERMEGSVRFESGARAVIHLEPPTLGRVQVQLVVDDSKGGVQAHLGADQEATREFLRQNQSDLREELVRQGFHSDKVEIFFDEEEQFVSPQGITSPNAVA